MMPKKITVEPSAKHPDVLDVRDAMRQVMDFFDLLTDQGNSDVVWNLTFASTNSPFTAEGVPVDLRTNAPAFGLVRNHVQVIERGLSQLQAGEPLDDDFPKENREIAIRMLKRNINGIGRTKIEFGDESPTIEFDPTTAERSLKVIQGGGDVLYDYLFDSFARKEVGSLEGRILDVGTDYEEPAFRIKEHRTGREIWCRIDENAREEMERKLTAGDVWDHRRVRVSGILNYDPSGKIVRLFDGRITYIQPKEVGIEDLHDPDFTEGMAPYEYLDRLRENEFG